MQVELPGQERVIAHYGEDAQSVVHMEECAELIQAISKMRRKKATHTAGQDVDNAEAYYNLVEEMADVLICMQQLVQMYSISDSELQMMIDRKTARQEERMHESDRRFFKG